MKRIVALVLTLTLIIATAGCASNKPKNGSQSATLSAKELKKIDKLKKHINSTLKKKNTTV
ncbi:MAG: hypothetical protein IIU39_07535 [Ruminococcus sp.]|nr:hypothetical protein [Ruminococcus sp.]